MENLELRMYSLVMYNLSPIQKGIQAYHATIEAVNKFGNGNSINEELFKDWAENWKTVIILDGGTSNDIYRLSDELWENNVGMSYFREPDLNNSVSAVSFIVDERVFNTEKYPDYNEWLYKQNKGVRDMWTSDSKVIYNEFIGGEKNVWLREFLKQFNLAR